MDSYVRSDMMALRMRYVWQHVEEGWCFTLQENHTMIWSLLIRLHTADHLVLLGQTPKSLIKNIDQRSLKIIGHSNLKLPSGEKMQSVRFRLSSK